MVPAMVGGGWCGLNTKGCKGHAHCHTLVWSDCGLIHTYVRIFMKYFTVALKGKSCVMQFSACRGGNVAHMND